MIHIVFNRADMAVLQAAIVLDDSLAGEVVQISDDFAVGPIENLHTEEGRAARNQWWRDMLAGGENEGIADEGENDDAKTIYRIAERLKENEDERVWVWVAQNSHDLSGYFWLLHYLKPFSGRVEVLHLNNLPFIGEKGNVFYPEWLHEIPAKEFLKAKKLARPITLSEFETEPDEWLRLAGENRGVRRLEGGKKLVQHDYDFFDAELKKFLTKDFQKVSRVLQQYFSKSKFYTGDVYLLWRLKMMEMQGLVEVQGEARKVKEYEARLKV